MTTATQEPKTGAEVLDLALDLCIPHPGNKERPLDESFLQSLRDKGQIVIALVRPHPTLDGKYEIINGARRRAGLEAISFPTLIAEVREINDQEAEELRAIENKHRVGLGWRQELEQIEEYLGRYPDQFSSIAGALAISVNQVRRRHGLLKKLSKSWLKAMKSGRFISWTVDHFESLIPFNEQQQEHFYNDDFKYGEDWIEVKELRERLAGDTHSLKGVAWDLNDVTLCPAAGSCADCPKRSGANTDLFDEVDPKIKGQDRCLDEECFEKKTQAFVGSKVSELRKEDPEVLAVSKSSYSPPAGSLGSDNYKVVKAGTKGAKKAVQVDGGSAGQIVYVKLNSEAKQEVARAQAGMPKKSLAERKVVREKQRDALAITKLITYIEDESKDLVFTSEAAEVLTHYILTFCPGGGITSDEKRAMAYKAKPYTQEEMWDLVEHDLVGRLQDHIRNMSFGSYSPAAKDNTIILCAWMVDADFSELRAEALAEPPDPKSWAAEKEEAKAGKGKKPKSGKPKKDKGAFGVNMEEGDGPEGKEEWDGDDNLDGDSEGRP